MRADYYVCMNFFFCFCFFFFTSSLQPKRDKNYTGKKKKKLTIKQKLPIICIGGRSFSTADGKARKKKNNLNKIHEE